MYQCYDPPGVLNKHIDQTLTEELRRKDISLLACPCDHAIPERIFARSPSEILVLNRPMGIELA